MNELIEYIESFGLARLGAIIGVTCGVALAMGLIIVRIGAPSMSVLYADLSFTDAQTVTDQLDQDGVDYDLRDSGGSVTVLAPRKDISALRIQLAGNGVMVGGGVGYEIFDDGQPLGATSFQQNINRLRALEGELSRTIASINGVRSARVHLVLPERELFTRDRETATASIILDAPGGLEPSAVRAIVNLTASAVPSLNAADVTVTDSTGALLASGGENREDAMAGSVEDKKIAAEQRIRRNVEEIVGRIVGAENVRVNVASEMDFSRVTESAEIVDPDSQTVLSSTTVEEVSSSSDPAASRGVSIANSLPGSQIQSGSDAAATSSNQRTEETTNYEISKTVRNAVREEGLVVKRLSVAVAINGAQASFDDDTLARIDTLIKSAIGFNPARGDSVSVLTIPFAAIQPVAEVAAAPITNPLAREDMMRLAEIAALAIIALGLVFFVLRPMFSASDAQPALANMGTTPKTLNAGEQNPSLAFQPELSADQRIDLAQVDGQVKASSVKKVSEIVKSHTDESASILRNWMREAS